MKPDYPRLTSMKAARRYMIALLKWKGSSWSAWGSEGMTAVDYPCVTALAVLGTNLYVGGGFNTAGGSPTTNIAKWDGSSWTPLGLGMDGGVNALVVLGSDL